MPWASRARWVAVGVTFCLGALLFAPWRQQSFAWVNLDRCVLVDEFVGFESVVWVPPDPVQEKGFLYVDRISILFAWLSVFALAVTVSTVQCLRNGWKRRELYLQAKLQVLRSLPAVAVVGVLLGAVLCPPWVFESSAGDVFGGYSCDAPEWPTRGLAVVAWSRVIGEVVALGVVMVLVKLLWVQPRGSSPCSERE